MTTLTAEPVVINESYIDTNALHDKDMMHIPVNMISVREGFNPRRYFSDDALNALVESIKAQGIVQPIVVKPNKEKDGFHLIAGERRFRASKLAGIESIPTIVRLVSDEDALAMAVTENSERQDVSAAEEAKACHRMMTMCDGDRQETALALGWSRKKLDMRLSLLHCSDNVLNALEQRQINIGHAELLAGISKSFQDESLAGIIDNKVSVSALKEMLGRYAYKLNEAVFDLSGCEGCPHNSTSTADMFDASLSDGHCMNRECYDKKTNAHLTAKKEELTQEFPVIWMDVEKASDMRRHLVREGEHGVGREQYNACQGCANFGAVMLTEKGKEGTVEQGICFDTSCNSKKVAEYQKELKEEQESSPVEFSETTGTVTASKPKTSKPKATNETPKKVKTFVHGKHYQACSQEVLNNGEMTRIFALLALVDSVKNRRSNHLIKPLLVEHGLEKLETMFNKAEMVTTLAGLSAETISQLIRAYSATLAGAIEESKLEYEQSESLAIAHAVMRHTQADMKQYFQVDKAFLETLTITGLKSLLEEAGFITWYDNKHGDGEAAENVLKGKRGEQIKAVLDSGFDWSGFVPKVANLP